MIWKSGDYIHPEYYQRCVTLVNFRHMAREPQELGKPSPPPMPLPYPCVVRYVGCFGKRDHDGYYVISDEHADQFNKYDIPKQEIEKKTILSFIRRLFK